MKKKTKESLRAWKHNLEVKLFELSQECVTEDYPLGEILFVLAKISQKNEVQIVRAVEQACLLGGRAYAKMMHEQAEKGYEQ